MIKVIVVHGAITQRPPVEFVKALITLPTGFNHLLGFTHLSDAAIIGTENIALSNNDMLTILFTNTELNAIINHKQITLDDGTIVKVII